MRNLVLCSALLASLAPQLARAEQPIAPRGAYGGLVGAAPSPLFLRAPSDVLGLVHAREPDAAYPEERETDFVAPQAQMEPRAPRRLGRQVGAGSAVWYKHRGRTASGEKFDPAGLTAAHRTLPFGTRVQVRNRQNGKIVTVRINDRIGKKASRQSSLVIDLSHAAARTLDIEGRAPVTLHLVSSSSP